MKGYTIKKTGRSNSFCYSDVLIDLQLMENNPATAARSCFYVPYCVYRQL
jgi:hypothetical protein